MTESTIIFSIFFVPAAEYGVAKIFMLARLRALKDNGQLRGNDGELVPLSSKMRAGVLKHRLLRFISDRTVGPVCAILSFS